MTDRIRTVVTEVDAAAEHLLIEITRVLDKQLWMTSAQR
jgi:DNA-binding ferritin-like protein